MRSLTRRAFIRSAAAGPVVMTGLGPRKVRAATAGDAAKPVLLGGTPVHPGGWPQWPEWRDSWEPAIVQTLRSGKWYRGEGGHVAEFEKAYANLLGARRCLATASGTTALLVSLHVMDVDAGDEVIVSPYTFIATYNAILDSKALPVFADTDPATLTMDPASIESRITERTRAILPVHIYGMPCDMDPINAIARKHKLAVIEDACQAWLAEYKGKKCGTLGDLGCFSFQNSKHLPSGEGGAVTGQSDALLDKCQSYHDVGRPYGSSRGERQYFTRGSNYRMQHFQALMLMQQLEKLVQDTARRRANAEYLSAAWKDVPGIRAVRLPENSQAVWHLYPLRYDAAHFGGLTRDTFVRALRAEGVPCSGGYHEQYFDGLLDEAIRSRGYQRLFGASRLASYRASLEELRGNQQVCATTVAITQNLLLADRGHIDHIIEAVRKIQKHGAALARTTG